MSAHRTAATYDWRLVRRLWATLRAHQQLLWTSLALLVLSSACRLALPTIVKSAIDRHLEPGVEDGLGIYIALFIGVATLEVAGKGLETWTLDLAGQNALFDLRVAVFSHLQRLSAAFYDRTPIGRLIGRVTTDIEALQELFSSGVVTVLGDFLFLGATLVILFAMNWRLTLVVLTVVPVLLALTLWVRIRVRAAYSQMIRMRSRLNAYIHEQVSGIPLIQLFARERLSRADFADTNADMRDAQLRSVRWESILSATTELLGSLTLALILWYGSKIILGAQAPSASGFQSALTLGALFAFIDYMQRFFVPLNDLSLKYTVMQSAMSAAERIFSLLDENATTPEPKTPIHPPSYRGTIAFRDVSFAYQDGDPVLDHVSFSIAAGEKVAIVGATGAGKTTILKLLTRLYDVETGTIELDGNDLREYALQDLRRHVGIVPQDVFMFGGDIVSNIRLGHPDITDAEAIAAANRLHLDEIVRRFPSGYREPVRERGANLSSGERQLIAFARVLAVAPCVLALDEATSNVDTQTERLLQEALAEVMRGRTALVIAHRLSTIRDADRILVMNKGRLVEEGTHSELVKAGGVYQNLHALQYQERSAQQ